MLARSAPDSATGHYVRCQLLAERGEVNAALGEWETARALALKNPLDAGNLPRIEKALQLMRAYIAKR